MCFRYFGEQVTKPKVYFLPMLRIFGIDFLISLISVHFKCLHYD